jgi:sulfate permease, SulP family
MLKKYQEFIPKSYLCFRRYSLAFFKKDLMAGITVGIVSLPLAMAFAMASGVAPERGLFTAIVAGFIISLLGGSKVQIGGPTGAFVIIVYTIVEQHGYDGLVIATLMAGVMLILMGVFKLGSLIKFVPHPLIVGFTTGIAVVVFSSQIKDLLGLHLEVVPVHFLDKWGAYFHSATNAHFLTACIGLGTLFFIILLRRFAKAIPWGIASIVIATAVCWALQIDVPTVSSRFGHLPRSLPMPYFDFDFSRVLDVMPAAITIALLAGIESLLSAVIADAVIGSRHKPNCELIAQGLANIGAIIFGGMPATAAIARTATNIKTGAQTPMAGMIHAVVVCILLWTCTSLVAHIPLAALSAVLVMVAWNMSELPHFFRLMKTSRGDVAILMTAFFLTVLIDLTVAVEVGMLLAAFLFMKRMSEVKHVIALDQKDPEHGIEVYKMRGPFFFGVTDRLKNIVHDLDPMPKVFVLRMKHVPVLDATALQTLREINDRCERQKTRLVLMEVQQEPADLLKQYGLEKLINENILKEPREVVEAPQDSVT